MVQGGLKDVAFSRISHEQIESNPSLLFSNAVSLYFQRTHFPNYLPIRSTVFLSWGGRKIFLCISIYAVLSFPFCLYFDIISANSPFSFRFRWAIPGKTILHTWEFSFILTITIIIIMSLCTHLAYVVYRCLEESLCNELVKKKTRNKRKLTEIIALQGATGHD